MPVTDDAIIVGLLGGTLAAIFWTSQSEVRVWRGFYRFIPPMVVCYFVPAIYNTAGLIDADASSLYYVVTRYLLPAALVLLTLSIDFPAIIRLGPKAVILFLTGTAGIMIGGPIALALWGAVAPGITAGDVWKGMATVAGSWIGGSANQVAMKEVFSVDDNLFGMMVAVDVVVGSLWLAFLLYLAGRADQLDARHGADTSALLSLREKTERFQRENARIPSFPDLMILVGVGLGAMGASHLVAGPLAGLFKGMQWAERLSLSSEFFWVVIVATTAGVLMSLTPMRRLEAAGASKVGTVMLYVLIATIGMRMNLLAISSNPGLFAVGATWILVHGALMYLVMRILRAPLFYMAVGSQANIGAAASAPVVASAFHPSLAPVGVLLAVLGYALGTYAAWVTGQLMRIVAAG
jgi:uncharacterized membrane protein